MHKMKKGVLEILKLYVQVEDLSRGVRVTAKVTNATDETAHLYFTSSQRISIRLLEKNGGGKPIYASEMEWMYMQVTEDVYLTTRESVMFEEQIPSRYFKHGHDYKGFVTLTLKELNGEGVAKKIQQPITFTRHAY